MEGATAVEDDDVEACFNELSQTVAVGGARADSSSSIELLALRVLRRQGVRLVLEQVRTREKGDNEEQAKLPLYLLFRLASLMPADTFNS